MAAHTFTLIGRPPAGVLTDCSEPLSGTRDAHKARERERERQLALQRIGLLSSVNFLFVFSLSIRSRSYSLPFITLQKLSLVPISGTGYGSSHRQKTDTASSYWYSRLVASSPELTAFSMFCVFMHTGNSWVRSRSTRTVHGYVGAWSPREK